MQHFCVLVFVLTSLLTCSAVGKDGKLHWTRPLIQARLDSQQTRLNCLSERLDHMMEEVKESRDVGHVQKQLQQLEGRIEVVEGNHCPNDDHVSCGRNSGQCVHHLLVCDNKVDCENGFDEANTTCENPILPGTSTEGYMYFHRCLTRGSGYGENDWICTITSNTRNAYLPSRLHFTATCTWRYRHKRTMNMETYTHVGVYSYGKRRLYWQSAPEYDGEGRMHGICDFVGRDITQCKIYNEADMTLCITSVYKVKSRSAPRRRGTILDQLIAFNTAEHGSHNKSLRRNST